MSVQIEERGSQIASDEALRVARQDAERAYGDLAAYRTAIVLEPDGWHIDYELRDPDVQGGGPHYVVSRWQPRIVLKRYEQ